MRFQIIFENRQGQKISQDIIAEDRRDAENKIRALGGYPLAIEPLGTSDGSHSRINLDALVLFNQELLALLKAGIPLLQALQLLQDHGSDKPLQASLKRIIQFISDGGSFSEALEKEKAFPPIYQSNIVAGERSGSMINVLQRWLAFQKFAQNSKRKITEALFYPAFLTIVLTLSIGLILNVVLPRFASFYSGGGIDLPWFTKWLLELATLFEATLAVQLVALIGLIFFIRWLWITPQGRALGERMILRIPKLGSLYKTYHSSVFCRTLGVLLAGGIPIVQALNTVAETCPSPQIKYRLKSVIDSVRSGAPLYSSIRSGDIVHHVAVEMIRIGENSSALPEMLDHVADFFDQEVEKATTAITNLIGPVLIVFMGIIVLGLLLAVYIPLFNAGSVIN